MTDAPAAPDTRFPAIRTLLAQRRLIVNGGALAVAVLIAWAGWRWSVPELHVAAALAGVAVHFILRVAIEVVSLVAETLMPQ